MKSILITGGAGLVGSVLTKGLKDKFNIRILDESLKVPSENSNAFKNE